MRSAMTGSKSTQWVAMISVTFCWRLSCTSRLDHLRFAGGVEPCGRLVQEQGPGPHGEHAGQADAFLLAVAQVVDRALCQREGIDGGQRLGDAPGHLGLGEPQVSRTEGHVFFHRGGKELVGRVLKDHAHAAVQVALPQVADVVRLPAALLPARDAIRRMRTFKSVVLPEPLAPMTATNSPSAARNERSTSAWIPSG